MMASVRSVRALHLKAVQTPAELRAVTVTGWTVGVWRAKSVTSFAASLESDELVTAATVAVMTMMTTMAAAATTVAAATATTEAMVAAAASDMS